MRQLAAEALGAFMLVFSGTGAIVVDASTAHSITHVGVALTFGLVVMSIIYALGDVSGAHVNPAVTIGFWIAGRFEGSKTAPYIAAQCVGAVAASATVRGVLGDYAALGATLPAGSSGQSFVLETLLTAMLMFVILNVSTGAKEKGIMAGAAIGSVVALEALFAGPICGASMNPARSLGPALVAGRLEDVWIYLIAPTLGALLAVPAYQLVRDEGRKSHGRINDASEI
ncbi:MAG: aquaporin [Planctomycetales bacterium]|nr:aquaporin [Planctomycetales bacterium]